MARPRLSGVVRVGNAPGCCPHRWIGGPWVLFAGWRWVARAALARWGGSRSGARGVAFNNVDCVASVGADLIEDGLPREAELAGGVVEFDVAVGHGRHEPFSDLVGQPNPPWRVFGCLLRGKEPFSEPAADRHGADPELGGGPP